MNIGIEEVIDNSFVISINKDRLNFFYEQWRKHGLPGMPKHVCGIQLMNNNYAITKIKKQQARSHMSVMSTHLMIVSMARAMNLPFVCIFEDDAVGCNDVAQKFESLLSIAPDTTDILVLGNIMLFGTKSNLGNGLIVPTKTHGLQSYIVFKKNYDTFINSITKDYSTGLTGYGENVFLTKDILFCQYSYMPETNQQWHKVKRGFFHESLQKEYINGNFQIL